MPVRAEFSVDPMSWHKGEAAVKHKVSALEGVDSVDIDMAAKKITVSFNGATTTLVDIKQAILGEGYTVTEL